ncbi:MAG TPA: YqgE/AlgH family protein [Saprospiraceae bacterium]|nr:YqgE/AlgH family protein [Saprospiraceae bacterium]MCB9269458.1 YqgE/AlgH family protein [Lewinellaceae bacterium]HPG06920.1 YqgE/AlgH family protein [Saprospiraceae bacterium]HPQ98524.1 YqgE/AlgH family protein [Saprospiraceae bacterium]HRV85158.1 YqgE/AlgH family protein [Saprospiraceae bacterium]
MVDREAAKGQILLAEPFMVDPNFRRSVVLLCEHQTDGSIGFILNKPLKMNVSELIADFPEFESEVYFGGPVATDTIHYIHNVGELLEESVEVNRGVYWGGDFSKLKFLISSKLVEPGNIRFFVGYSGWSSGQLHEELGYGSWVIADMHANYLFKSHPASLWKQVMSNKGHNYEIIAQMPDSINWN